MYNVSKGNKIEAKRIIDSLLKWAKRSIGFETNSVNEKDAVQVVQNIEAFLHSDMFDKQIGRQHMSASIWTAMSSSDDSLSASALARIMKTTNKKPAIKGKFIRRQMENGICQSFVENCLGSRRKKRWDNFDEEIEESIYAFSHDPNYVRPDNFSKQKYKCTDEHGCKCFHKRHNWFTSGSLRMQHNLYFDSVHFKNLLDELLVSTLR